MGYKSGPQTWGLASTVGGSSLMEGFPSQGVRHFATNFVLSRGINYDGGTHYEGYKGGQQTLYCQEGSTLMEGTISRATKVGNKLGLCQEGSSLIEEFPS